MNPQEMLDYIRTKFGIKVDDGPGRSFKRAERIRQSKHLGSASGTSHGTKNKNVKTPKKRRLMARNSRRINRPARKRKNSRR